MRKVIWFNRWLRVKHNIPHSRQMETVSTRFCMCCVHLFQYCCFCAFHVMTVVMCSLSLVLPPCCVYDWVDIILYEKFEFHLNLSFRIFAFCIILILVQAPTRIQSISTQETLRRICKKNWKNMY